MRLDKATFIALLALLFGMARPAAASDIAKKVTSIIVDKLGVDEKEVTPNASFAQLALESPLAASIRKALDGRDIASVLGEYEKAWGIQIPDGQVALIQSADQLVIAIGRALIFRGLEDGFGVEIPLAAADAIDTLVEAVAYLKRALAEPAVCRHAERLSIEGTPKTPTISFDGAVGAVTIRGRSIPENSIEFYRPLVDSLDHYARRPARETWVDVYLTAIDAGSTDALGAVLKKLEAIHKGGSAVTILWHYDVGNQPIAAAGKQLQAVVNVPFKMVQVAE